MTFGIGRANMGYDRAITLFSPDGRLFQIEYALEAVKRGATAIGVRTQEGVILTVEKQPHAKLIESSSLRKIFPIDDHVCCAIAGLTADARVLVSNARVQAQMHRITYDSPPPVEMLTRKVCDVLQIYTQHAGVRPFGCSFLMTGVDVQGPQLFTAEPSGSYWGYMACAIGSGAPQATSFLEEHYSSSFSLDEGIGLSLASLKSSVEDGRLEPSMVEIASIPSETRMVTWIPADKIADYIANL
jgi:proteasome alpha subunit